MFSVLVLGGIILAGQVDAVPGGDLQLEVRRLVRRLDSPQLAQREEAEEKLIGLGTKILDLLPEPNDRTAAEVRLRVGRVRQKLQRALAESVVKGSEVTLVGSGLSLSSVLAEIEDQTGNRIIYDRRGLGPDQAGEPQLEVAFNSTPFWEALEEVLDQASLSMNLYGNERAVYVTERSGTELPDSARVFRNGPFRFEAVRLDAVRDLRDTANGSLRLALQVAWEPRLEPISLRQDMADVEAVDENGNPLPIDSRQTKLEVPVDSLGIAKQLVLPLALPSRDVKQIARLNGKLAALVPGKLETFRFTQLEDARQVERRIAGATVVLQQVRKNDSVWEVHVRIRFDQAEGSLASHRNWIYDNEAYLEGPSGEPIPYDAFETNRRTEDELGIGYFFALDEPLTDYAFVYKTPGLILTREFEYEIRDVDLP